jgi:hypothetical protein
MQSDQGFGVVRLTRADDGVVVGGLMALFAAVQGGIEDRAEVREPLRNHRRAPDAAAQRLFARPLRHPLAARGIASHVDLEEE